MPKPILYTTFEALRNANACTEGYHTLARHLDGAGNYGGDTPIDLLTILQSNGLDDCRWCFRAAQDPNLGIEILRFWAIDCAERALAHAARVLDIFEADRPGDDRPRKAIETGRETLTMIRAARHAARAAETRWQEERLIQYLTHGLAATEMECDGWRPVINKEATNA